MMAPLTAQHARLGELLLKHTSLSQVQLDECLKIQEEEGGRLGDILLRKTATKANKRARNMAFAIQMIMQNDAKKQGGGSGGGWV